MGNVSINWFRLVICLLKANFFRSASSLVDVCVPGSLAVTTGISGWHLLCGGRWRCAQPRLDCINQLLLWSPPLSVRCCSCALRDPIDPLHPHKWTQVASFLLCQLLLPMLVGIRLRECSAVWAGTTPLSHWTSLQCAPAFRLFFPRVPRSSLKEKETPDDNGEGNTSKTPKQTKTPTQQQRNNKKDGQRPSPTSVRKRNR